jgi:hypothetical protein
MAMRFLKGLRRRRGDDDDVVPDMEGSLEGDSTGFASLKQFEKMHRFDPNLPLEELEEVDIALNTANVEKGAEIEQILAEDNSPYPEVRASVRNFDVDMPVNTIRAWTIGMFLCTLGSAVNMLLSLRNPSISLTTFVIQLIAYPLGLLWDLLFPDRVFNLWGLKFNLRPGRFNYKEHVIIVVMSNVGSPGKCVMGQLLILPRLRMAVVRCMPPM